MALMVTAGETKNYTPAPEGVHQAVCVDVIDQGLKESTFDGKTKLLHKVDLAWQIDEAREDGKRFVVYKRYTLSIGEKATLRHDLESWRGKPFTDAERKGFDLESITGANCLINVQHKKSMDGTRTYANVISVMPLIKGMAKIAAVDYVRREAAPTTNTTPTERQTGEDDEPVIEVERCAEPITLDDIPF